MSRWPIRSVVLLLLFYGVLSQQTLSALPENDGPFGLRWGMPKEALEQYNIRLCCRQVGKWGERYQVNHRDFEKLPKRLGDEDKLYLYFGHTNTLLRMYVGIRKVDGRNRFLQLNQLIEKRYDVLQACTQRSSPACNGYAAYTRYKRDEVEVVVALEENLTAHDTIFITLLNTRLYTKADDGKNPF